MVSLEKSDPVLGKVVSFFQLGDSGHRFRHASLLTLIQSVSHEQNSVSHEQNLDKATGRLYLLPGAGRTGHPHHQNIHPLNKTDHEKEHGQDGPHHQAAGGGYYRHPLFHQRDHRYVGSGISSSSRGIYGYKPHRLLSALLCVWTEHLSC